MENTKKKGVVGLIVIAIIVVLVVAGIVWKVFIKKPVFSAVYLTTGDLYFGEVVKFPKYGIKNPYFIQTNTQDPNNPVSIQRFQNVFWQPEGFMNLSSDKVIWTAHLNSEGDLADLLANNPTLTPPASTGPTGAGAPGAGAPTQVPPVIQGEQLPAGSVPIEVPQQ